ncbi:MAG: hypothetical protein KUG77_18515, partial [Nannocystaceae bacterium]|nr:hypothetical protein [Nannocystaceae bacterium]
GRGCSPRRVLVRDRVAGGAGLPVAGGIGPGFGRRTPNLTTAPRNVTWTIGARLATLQAP